MFRTEDIRIDIGRSSNGNFLRMIHVPTGIQRLHPGPMKGVNQTELQRRWLDEIKAEVLTRVPDPNAVPTSRRKTKRQRGPRTSSS